MSILKIIFDTLAKTLLGAIIAKIIDIIKDALVNGKGREIRAKTIEFIRNALAKIINRVRSALANGKGLNRARS